MSETTVYYVLGYVPMIGMLLGVIVGAFLYFASWD